MADSASWTDRVDETVNDVVEPVAGLLADIVFWEVPLAGAGFPLIVGWLVAAGVVFTGYFSLVQVRRLPAAFRLVRGRYEQPGAPGEISHFQALTSAVSGTVGLGNIAGVAIAVSVGGPGAVFWMVLCGLLGMATKFVECTLGVKYREVHGDGTVSGGPMHYLRRGLAERGLPRLGRALAAAVCCALLSFTLFGGNLFQVNQSLEQVVSVTGEEGSFFATSGGAIGYGLLVAALVALVLLGGVRAVGRVTSRLVPAMAAMYVLACLLVIGFRLPEVPAALGTVVTGAFSPEGVAGGAVGALVQGFRRAAFSNEAGIGSAPIAHSAVRTRRPATEGLVAMVEPFLDTVVICTMTALTIVIADGPAYRQTREAVAGGGEPADDTGQGISITSDAFATALPWFPGLLTVAVVLFAFSTIITWAYYGLKCWCYLFGKGQLRERIYQALFCSVTVAGALLSLGTLVSLADTALFLAALCNIAGLYFLAPVVRGELHKVLEYLRHRDAGASDEDVPAAGAVASGAAVAASGAAAVARTGGPDDPDDPHDPAGAAGTGSTR